jgi:hypothetical protein
VTQEMQSSQPMRIGSIQFLSSSKHCIIDIQASSMDINYTAAWIYSKHCIIDIHAAGFFA